MAGPDVKIEWFVYNVGPSAKEAILANSIDLTYVGPNPAINAYAKSRGREIRIIAGAANGGAALVIQPDSQLKVASDFRGKRIATPQLGNTQDVAARAWRCFPSSAFANLTTVPIRRPSAAANSRTQLRNPSTFSKMMTKMGTPANHRMTLRMGVASR